MFFWGLLIAQEQKVSAQFALSIHCDDEWENRNRGSGASIAIALSGPSERGSTFVSRGNGAAIVAFLKPRAVGLMFRERYPLFGQLVDARELLTAGLVREIAAIARSRRSLEDRVFAIARWIDLFCDQRPSGSADGQRVATATELIASAGCRVVPDLAAAVSISRRQLEIDFAKWLGLSPGQYRNAIRVERTLAAMATNIPLARIAAEHGFADQAHMSRVVRSRTGYTPLQLRRLAHAHTSQIVGHALGGRTLIVDQGNYCPHVGPCPSSGDP